jgi:PAS domain S-box-containing protein
MTHFKRSSIRSSIRTKLKTAILATTLLAVVFVFAGFFVYDRITFNNMLLANLTTQADVITGNIDAALIFGNSSDAEQVLKSLSKETHVVAAALYDHYGKRFAMYEREGERESIPFTPPREGAWFEDNAIVLSQPIALNGRQIGTIYITKDLLEREAHFRSYIEIGLLVLFGSLAIAYAVATIVERAISKPILSLAETAHQVSERQDYSIRANKLAEDEIGFLTDAVNQMLAQIQEGDGRLRKAHDELEGRVKERTANLVTANEELKKRDLLLSTSQQIAHLGSWEWDLQTLEVTWSDELYRILGVHRDEFGHTMESFLGLLHSVDRQIRIGHLQEAIRTHEPFDFVESVIRPDRVVRILHSQGRVVTDENGTVVKLLGVSMDVTERKRAEEKFRNLLECAPDAMIIARQDGRIVLVNEQTERLFGYSRSELLGQQTEMLLPERLRAVMNYFITPTRVHGDESPELYGLRKNNTEFPVEVSLSPLETEEGILLSSAIRDITEQTRLRSRLLAAERQRSTDLRRYIQSVQHAQEDERQRISRDLHDDLCQRLSGMKLNVEVTADEIPAKERTLRRRLLGFNKQCEEMIVEVRRMAANLRPVVLDDFGLVSALGLLTREFEKLHKTPVDLEINDSVRMDLEPQLEIALYRIAQEALSNIAKHAQATRVKVGIRKEDDTVVLRIGDNGKGLAGEVGQRTDDLHGLGLISMRERAGLLGGLLAFDSTRKGTTITVTIPITPRILHEEDATSYS